MLQYFSITLSSLHGMFIASQSASVSMYCERTSCHVTYFNYGPFSNNCLPIVLRLVLIPRRMFGAKREEVTGVWDKLHNEERHNLYFLPIIVRVITLRRMEHRRMRDIKMLTKFWSGNLQGVEFFETLGFRKRCGIFSVRRGACKSLAFPIFLFATQPIEFFLDGLKKLEQQSHKCVELRREYLE
jgi:hypothetical protein